MKKSLKKLLSKVKRFVAPKNKVNNDASSNFNSKEYWENRYLSNNNSGAGSYGRLAKFKAKIINKFIVDNKINSVIEFGCGDGNQLKMANYPTYIGYDVSKKSVNICREVFKNDLKKSFKIYNPKTFNLAKNDIPDVVLSLDVIYHLIEEEVFEDYMKRLFSVAKKYVIIYSSNYNERIANHVKCRKFTDWIDANVSSNWKLKEFIKNEFPFNKERHNDTSMADFYIYEYFNK